MTKVLYVEDHEAQREIMRQVLELHGYEFDVACNGEEGVRKARLLCAFLHKVLIPRSTFY